MRNLNLKACPFCGGEASLKLGLEVASGSGCVSGHVECNVCGVKTKPSLINFDDRIAIDPAWVAMVISRWDGDRERSFPPRDPVADRAARIESALGSLLALINEDKDGGYFLCAEAKDAIIEANLALTVETDFVIPE